MFDFTPTLFNGSTPASTRSVFDPLPLPGSAADANKAWIGRTVEQVEKEIRARTEACMDEKKNNGYSGFNIWGNREKNRGQCEAYARADLAEALAAAQARENVTKFAIDDATTAQAGWMEKLFKDKQNSPGGQQQSFLIYLGAFVFVGLLAYIIFK